MTDIEIAQKNEMIAISEVAKKIGIEESALELYGKHKAKINFSKLRELQEKAREKNARGKLILVTATGFAKSENARRRLCASLRSVLASE